MSDKSKVNFDYTKVKIKREKLSPPPAPKIPKDPDEVINEIIPKLFGTPPRKDAAADDKNSDEKKSIEPVKSSNEILAELFKVFNAAPPETLLNDDYLLQKKKKHKKDKKHKKKSKNRGSKSNSDDDKDDGMKSVEGGVGASDKDSTVSDSDRSRKKRKKKKKKKSTKRDGDGNQEDEKKYSEKRKSEHKSSSQEKRGVKKNLKEQDFVISDNENYTKSPTESISLRHVKIEDSEDGSHHHRHHHHRHHHHHHNEDQLEQKQPDQQQQEQPSSALNSRKIIIKSVKDTKIFKEAEDKQKELSKHSKKHRHYDRDHEKSSDRNDDKVKDKESSSHRRNSKRESSEISLSDEETYLKEKEMSFYRSSDSYYSDRRSRHHGYYNDRSSRSNYRDTSRERSRSHYRRNRWRSSRSRSRSRHRGRSRSRSTELVIDKKRLLEIARKNAISMFKNGSLPGTQGMTQEIKDKVLMRMRYGGKSVEELTEFCKKLSQGENLNDLSDLTSNEGDSDHDKYGNEKAFHHPFVLKDRGPIVMNIKNATQIPPKTAEQTKAILMQYPVSSGQEHRLTENEWVPVSPKKSDPPIPPPAILAAPSKPQPPKNVFQKPLPLNEEQQPAFVPTLPVNTTTNGGSATASSAATTTTAIATATAATISTTTPTPVPVPAPTPLVPPIPVVAVASQVQPPPPPPPASTVAPTVTAESVFPQSRKNIDVSTVIAKRLNAMRKLQENPTDPEALKMMYDAQKNMSAWANSKYTPGQFTGSTGANILSAKELTSGFQAWAKRDQLTSTTPVSGGMGMHLLQKMGWKPGEGLGKTKNGALQPLLLDVKMDKRGLVATEEDPTIPKVKRKKIVATTEVQKTLEQKHPVSLLDEISAKRKWGPPVYDVVSDEGPSHRKSFIFQVVVNGVMYQPTIPCRTKKEAKALAAKYCLQQLGIITC